MILAAGRGERMRPLTDELPKPLIPVAGKPLIAWQLERLQRADFTEVVINLGWLGSALRDSLGDGGQFGLTLFYSEEGWPALETGGGIRKALPLLGAEPFAVINSDIWTDYDYSKLPGSIDRLAHLVMVDNPPQHPEGDFSLNFDNPDQQGKAAVTSRLPGLTFSGIGVYSPKLFENSPEGAFPLGPLLREQIAAGQVTGEYHAGEWADIGTPDRLAKLEALLS